MERAYPFRCLLRPSFATATLVWLLIFHGVGCQSWITRDKDKNNHFAKENKRFKELLEDPDRPRLVGEVAAALGLVTKHYDAYGIAANLPSTGGIVKPSPQRDMMISEMRARNVESPEAVLDHPSTALVKVRVYANPCDSKGEIVDVDVENCSECLATDLTEGHVLESKLREMAYLGGRMRTSEDKAIAAGDLIILPACYTKKPEANKLQGVIVGGGRLMHEHQLGLRMDSEFRHVFLTRAIESAINARFFYQAGGKQHLVAEGKNDWYLSLGTVPKYKRDPSHFMSVILATGFAETIQEQEERLQGCKKLLLRRETVRRAAAELESIGNDQAKAVLLTGLHSTDPEIRFHSAYSLAYLDHAQSVPVLKDLAKTQVAFRPLCLVGLTVNEDASAREALEELLQESTPELRYGAFCAIRDRNPSDFAVNGQMIGQAFQFVQVPSSTPMLAVSFQKQKEVVLFGNNATVSLSATVKPTASLVLSPVMGDQIKIAKRHFSGEIATCVVPNDIVSVLRGIGTVEGNYNDAVQILDIFSRDRSVATPVVFNPRPFAGREFKRADVAESTAANAEAEDVECDEENSPVKIDHASIDEVRSNKSWWPKMSMSWLSWGTKTGTELPIPSDEELSSGAASDELGSQDQFGS